MRRDQEPINIFKEAKVSSWVWKIAGIASTSLPSMVILASLFNPELSSYVPLSAIFLILGVGAIFVSGRFDDVSHII